MDKIEERFWAKVDKTDTCWLWTGTTTNMGYGRVTQNGWPYSTHRVSWVYAYGEIPPGMLVLHKCDVRTCVNPDHLFLGTQKDNIRDMMEKGRSNFIKGEKHYSTRFTEEQIKEIRRRYVPNSKTDGQAAMGREFGVNRGTIGKIVHNQRWRHV